MASTRRELLATTALTASAVVAGCTGQGDSTASPGGDPGPGATTPAETPTATMGDGEDGGSATVQVSTHPDHGEILVGPDEMTLYMFDSDTKGSGESTCSDSCASAWPPLTVDDEPTVGADVTAEVATFERADGSTQVAANGWPLYYYANDESPGDVTGQGSGGVWWVLGPDGTPKRGGTSTDDESETTDGGMDGDADADGTDTETDGYDYP